MEELKKRKIAIFASGKGSNAKAIIQFETESCYEVCAIVCNKKNAGVLKYAQEKNIPTILLDKKSFYDSKNILNQLEELNIDCIVLAGFLWLIPNYLIEKFPNKIINIHPSLLPKYGGKGMYGMNVHKAVFSANEKESGITIHLVNKEYDKGKILAQESIDIRNCKSAEEIAEKVLKLEHHHFPRVIHQYIQNV